MYRIAARRFALLAGGFLAVWLFLRYMLPIALPFLLGLLLAVAAEPAVGVFTRLKLPRWAATGLGVTLTLILLMSLVGVLGAILVKELGIVAGRLPDLQNTAQQAADRLHIFLDNTASHVPDGVRPLVTRSVDRLFSSGSAFLEQATVRIPDILRSFLSRVPDGALGIGTGILSGFMLSVRLPKLKAALAQRVPERVKTRLLPALKQSKTALCGWLKAQLKLSAITYGIVVIGLLLLQIPLAPLWALAIAAVDAVPLLGTGTILLPWTLVCVLQRQHFKAIGLVCIYGCALFTRTVLEPRLVGRQLGLDPLVTLVFLYLGYRFWGILGMLLSPMLAAALTAAGQNDWQLPAEE